MYEEICGRLIMAKICVASQIIADFFRGFRVGGSLYNTVWVSIVLAADILLMSVGSFMTKFERISAISVFSGQKSCTGILVGILKPFAKAINNCLK